MDNAKNKQILDLGRLSASWFYRYKLYHIPFWCLYHYVWWAVAIGNPFKAADSILFSPYSVKYLFYVVFEALAVYLNLYVLMPRFLAKHKFTLYGILLTATILVTALFIVAGYYVSSAVSGITLRQLYGDGSNCFYYFMGYALPSAFASMTLAMVIKLLKNSIQAERLQQQADKEKLETELAFLKHQFNPHFLFNSINSIFVLIRKDPARASASLARFSELLRHQLYDCDEVQIPLDKEAGFLKNYIELEKLRQSKTLQLNVEMDAHYPGHIGIAPFILMAFVENAFKHVSRHESQPNRIIIELHLKDAELSLVVTNTMAESITAQAVPYSGIGLKNVKRRLELVYPDKHELLLVQKEGLFRVTLRLLLNELSVHASGKETFAGELR